MGLDIWYREDCQRILASVLESHRSALNAAPALDTEHAAAYQRGFTDAMRAVAVGFGLAPSTQIAKPKKEPKTVASSGWR